MDIGYDIRVAETEADRDAAFFVRRAVFIDEQQVPEEIEMDQFDERFSPTIHFVATKGTQPVGAARLRTYADGIGKVERVAVTETERGTGLGRALMEVLEQTARGQGYEKLKLNAQCHAQRFYEKLGYEQVGEMFVEAGIDHVAMEKKL
ncbi:GNAT family N-acetyltransferase [Brevibacillus fluminis]|uniref:GNAT family N-acetyltransferase n=1 Tax=Brevibacillus fluminis TaxID=511487 RepID=UPI003F8AF9C2